MASVADILQIIEQIAPKRLAEDWDNVGLQFGDPRWPAARIFVALDPTIAALETAVDAGADLLVTHHPLIFKPLKSVDVTTPTGAMLDLAARKRVAIFAAHTNLDSVEGGINDVLAEKIGLVPHGPLSPADGQEAGEGLGRIGRFGSRRDLKSVAEAIKAQLGLKSVKFAGSPDMAVQTAAICSGGGSGVVADFMSSDADVFVSGDLNHHHAIDVAAGGRGLIDVGHYASEQLIVPVLAGRLEQEINRLKIDVAVTAWDDEPDPFTYI